MASLLDRIDPVGVTIGATSLVVQAFNGCVEAFDLWSKSKGIGKDAVLFQVKLDIQGASLRAWGLQWGIERGDHLGNPLFDPPNGDVAVRTLTAIHEITRDLKSIGDEFNLQLQSESNTAAASLAGLDRLADPDSVERRAFRSRARVIESESSRQKGLQWGLSREETDRLFSELDCLMRGLYRSFPPPRTDASAALVTNRSLTGSDQARLQALSEMSGLTIASTFAALKKLSIELESRLDGVPDRKLQKRKNDLRMLSVDDETGSRSTATFRGEEVLVEWKTASFLTDWTTSLEMARRVDNIARLLRSDRKPAELRTLNCVGYVKDRENSRYGYIFQLPNSGGPHWTLNQRLDSSQPQVPVDERRNLARVLSKVVAYLHLSHWLHKSIRSHNILFFASSLLEVDLAQPYLVGFDFSRADEADPVTEIPDASLEFDLYRHPDSQGNPIDIPGDDAGGDSEGRVKRKNFTKEFDIYSIGILLLEIGHWRRIADISAEAKSDPQYGEDTPARFRGWLVDNAVSSLEQSMGVRYANVIVKCLNGDFDSRQPLEVAFYVDVVRELDLDGSDD